MQLSVAIMFEILDNQRQLMNREKTSVEGSCPLATFVAQIVGPAIPLLNAHTSRRDTRESAAENYGKTPATIAPKFSLSV